MQFNEFDLVVLGKSSGFLRAVTHPLRIALLNFILEKEPVAVHDIHTTLHLDQSLTSQHLRILRKAGVVRTHREGKQIFYSTDRDRLVRSLKAIQDFDRRTLESRKKVR